jgi:hypothetical protein
MSNSALNVLRLLLALTTGCISIWGCTRTEQVQDLAIEKISITDSDHWYGPWPDRRSLLRVDLSTKSDLTYMVWEWDLHGEAKVVFCNHPGDDVLLGMDLFASSPRAGEIPQSLYMTFFPRPRNGPGPHLDPGARKTYHLLLNIAALPHPPTPGDLGMGRVGFDLLHHPEDICISLTGQNSFISRSQLLLEHRLRSNTVRLSSDAIREALKSAQVYGH